MDCVNLRERFGRQYRVEYEESYYAQYGPRARVEDPWLQIIPCARGHIYPHGRDILAASTDKAGQTARRLKALPGVTLWQDGDDGATVLFPVEMFDQVAELMKPRRRRQVSDQERQRLRELGAKYGFQPGTGARGESAVCVGSD